jgi:nascent polypeptide-associated complex subunit alpha
MIPGMNPRQMKQVMKRMGVQQQELDVSEVIFRMADRDLVITNPSVSKVNMMGQETFQVAGETHEVARDSTPDISEEDVETVMAQADCSKDEAEKAINDANGDLAEAIMSLKN